MLQRRPENAAVFHNIGGAVHTGSLADLLYRDIGEVLFLKQFKKHLVHAVGGSEVFTLGSVQGDPPHLFSKTVVVCRELGDH